jgi:hypothetical protein
LKTFGPTTCNLQALCHNRHDAAEDETPISPPTFALCSLPHSFLERPTIPYNSLQKFGFRYKVELFFENQKENGKIFFFVSRKKTKK